MKYVILIYGNPKNWQHPIFLQYGDLSQEEHDQSLAKFDAFNVELAASGKLLAGSPLAAPETTKTITERNGVVSITDGPFAEAKEQLAGFLLVECDAIDEAYEIAKNFPDIKYAAVEIRPVAVSVASSGGTSREIHGSHLRESQKLGTSDVPPRGHRFQ